MDAPEQIAVWVGGLVLAFVVPELLRKFLNRGDKAAEEHAAAAARIDAEWRAEVRNDLKRLIDGQQVTNTDVAVLRGRLDALEIRQKEQAAAHLAAIDKVTDARKGRR